MQKVATAVALIATLFVGFLQLTGWLLIPLALLSAYGMQAYGSAGGSQVKSYAWSFVASLALLAIVE